MHNYGIPNYMLEYYLEMQERKECEHEKKHSRDAYCAECREKVKEAAEDEYPILDFWRLL